MNINNVKHILKAIALVCLICFITDKIIFFIFNKVSDNVYTGQAVGKLNHYLKVKETKKLLIFGSSKANHNIDPKILDENSFNMGLDGGSIAYVTMLNETIENNEDQTILIQIESEDIFSKNYDGDDISPLAIKYHRNAIIKKELDKTNYVNPFHHIF